MKILNLSLICAMLLSLCILTSCGKKTAKEEGKAFATEKKTEKKEKSLPEGYPAELTLPPGFKPGDVRSGSGSSSGGGKGDQTYKTYELWRMNPGNAPEIIAHYKKLLADLGYEGEWKGDGVEESARGRFTKGQNELEVSLSAEQISFKLKVFDK